MTLNNYCFLYIRFICGSSLDARQGTRLSHVMHYGGINPSGQQASEQHKQKQEEKAQWNFQEKDSSNWQ